jgi:TPR repeat protein
MRVLCLFAYVGVSLGVPAMVSIDEIPSASILETLRLDVRSGAASAERTYLLGLYTYYELAVGVGVGSGSSVGGGTTASSALFYAAAERGYGPAALALGLLAERGEMSHNKVVDTRAAVSFYRKAFSLGESAGAVRAAALMVSHAVPPADGGPKEAAVLLAAAVAAGHVPARGALAELFEYGAGVERDWPRARVLYESGCKGEGRGTSLDTAPDADACYHLSLMYAYGRGGGGADFIKAISAATAASAAAPGRAHGPAEVFLGNLHAAGQGVPTDYDAALAHYYRAVATGDIRAVNEAKAASERLGVLVEQARKRIDDVLNSFEVERNKPEPQTMAEWL